MTITRAMPDAAAHAVLDRRDVWPQVDRLAATLPAGWGIRVEVAGRRVLGVRSAPWPTATTIPRDVVIAAVVDVPRRRVGLVELRDVRARWGAA